MAKKTRIQKSNQKPLTLDGLVKYNQEVLFPALDDKFAKIDGRFDKADDKFAKIDGRFDKADDRFAKIDDKFVKVNERFNKIDARFDKVDEEIEEKFDKIMVGQDKILNELVNLRAENTASAELYKMQDRKIENHDIRIITIEKKLNIVKTNL